MVGVLCVFSFFSLFQDYPSLAANGPLILTSSFTHFQADTLAPYLNAIERTITATLCLQNFGSQKVERHNKPEVEMQGDKELLMTPVVIARDKVKKELLSKTAHREDVLAVCLLESSRGCHFMECL
jgi:hypothetical protein